MRVTKWRCGFCGSGNHDRCSAPVETIPGALVCSCACSPKPRCLVCRNDTLEELDVVRFRCVDALACGEQLLALTRANPLSAELRLVRALGDKVLLS